ncbi:hypothetical protein FA13DRAFT_1734490 [Coprinellus micaceus]|uniref:Uncharacterized protein n=1 Tax=Coprinellus micaceus TaxID=71717 RepID=A0A4Y7T6E4_COPMI|nr:hypothetical protein FA13DRAFT_1734490 [Coprinellus micaceus]
MAIEEIRNYGNVPNGLANLEKVVLAKRYRIPYWFIEGYITLVENWSTNRWPLETLGSNLGWETTSRILALAVKAREPPPNFESPATPVLNCSVCGNGYPGRLMGLTCHTRSTARIVAGFIFMGRQILFSWQRRISCTWTLSGKLWRRPSRRSWRPCVEDTNSSISLVHCLSLPFILLSHCGMG